MTTRIVSLALVMAVGLSYLGYRQLRTASAVAAQDARSAAAAPAPSNARERWAFDLATRLGNTQPSADIVALIVAWTNAEDRSSGAFERNNPLNTTETSAAMMTINSDGVKGYATYEDGMLATVQTLSYNYPGYAEIVAGIQSNDPNRALQGMYASPWGTDTRTVESIYQNERPQGNQVAESSNMIVATNGKADIVPDWQQHINAGFYTINCGAWSFQTACQHYGTDIGGQGEGTPVYAPYSGTYTGCQDNGDSGPYIGKWIEYTANDGAQFLINHFRDSPYCGAPAGTRIEAGDFIGTMRGDANHVHVQVTVGGALVDFEEYSR